MTIMLKSYPKLPRLTLEQCVQVFKVSQIGPSHLARVSGMSRVSISRWLHNHHNNPNNATLETVSTLAYQVLRALKHKQFPKTKDQNNQPGVVLDALSDANYGQPLIEIEPQDLLPKTWLEQFDLPKAEDATP